MNKKQAELFKKYEEGLTSLEEEAVLFDELGQHNKWFQMLQQHKKSSPGGLENEIWNKIKNKIKSKIRYIRRIGSIAATFILLISLGIIFMPWNKKSISNQNREMTYEEKTAVLKEALAMFPPSETKIPQKDILYEDENLIIYLR